MFVWWYEFCFIAYPGLPLFAQGIGQQGNEIPPCQGFILQARLLHLSLCEHSLCVRSQKEALCPLLVLRVWTDEFDFFASSEAVVKLLVGSVACWVFQFCLSRPWC